MSDEMYELQEEIIELYKLGVDVDVEIINQIENGNISDIELGFMPLFTFTDYIKKRDSCSSDWSHGESVNSIEKAMKNGIERAKKIFKINI